MRWRTRSGPLEELPARLRVSALWALAGRLGVVGAVGCHGVDTTTIELQQFGWPPPTADAGVPTQETAQGPSEGSSWKPHAADAGEDSSGGEGSRGDRPDLPPAEGDAGLLEVTITDAGDSTDAGQENMCDSVPAPACERLGGSPPARDSALQSFSVRFLTELRLSCELAALSPAPGLTTIGFLNDAMDLVRALMECPEAPLDPPTLSDWIGNSSSPLAPDPVQVELLVNLVVVTLEEELLLSNCESSVLLDRLRGQAPPAEAGPWSTWSNCEDP